MTDTDTNTTETINAPAKTLKVLFIGEIVGSPGVYCVKKLLPKIRKENQIDLVIANGEGTTGGFGLGKNHAIYLHKLGIDVITSGECIYYKKDMVPFLLKTAYVLRPANYPYGNPGRGWLICSKANRRIAIINLLGQSGFRRVHLANPYILLPNLLQKLNQETNTILVDFHAVTTAEKNTLFHHIDGKVSAVIGTHFKVVTADERIMPGGTAVITDAGRTGSSSSVGGFEAKIEITKFLTQIPERSKPSWENLELQGVLLAIGADGKSESIERIKLKCKEVPDDDKSNCQ